jgi:chromosome segregation ATPase
MREFIQKVRNYVPVILGAMTVDGYRRTVLNDNVTKRYENATNDLENTNIKLDNLYSELLEKKQSVSILDAKDIAIRCRIEELLESFRKTIARIKEYRENVSESQNNQSMIDAIQQEAEKIVERVSCEIEELNIAKSRKSVELEDLLKSISNDSNNQLLDNLIENFNSILSNLSTAQMGALGHILLAVGIYYSAVNIGTAFYGDKIIIYFKLEDKYPRLAK